MPRRKLVFCSVFALLLLGAFSKAQVLTLEDLESDALGASGIANTVPALALFGMAEGARRARLSVDAGALGGIDADLFKLPLAYEFAPVWRGVKPYVQLTFGRFEIDKRAAVTIFPAAPTGIEVNMRGEAVVAGVGATIPLVLGTSLRPTVFGGYARIRSDAATSGPFSGLLLSVVDGILADARLESPIAGASLSLRHEADIGGNVAFDGSLGFGLLYAPVTVATDPAIDQAIPFPAISAQFEADGPLWKTEQALRLRWLGFAGVTFVPALPEDIAGIPLAAEIGLGLRLNGPDLQQGVTLRASIILGDRVTGWSLGVGLDF